MIQWQNISSYLGRNVQIARADYVGAPISGHSLADSLLLVMLGARFDDERIRRSFFSALIGSTPLAIVVFGVDARLAFDTLIDVLARGHSPVHIMTKLLKEGSSEEAIRDFFQTTWPAEERFDDWQKYSVILTGEFQISEIAKPIERACQ